MNLIVVGSAAGLVNKCIIRKNKLLDYDIIADADSAAIFAKAVGKVIKWESTENGVIIHTDNIPIEVELIEKREHTKKLFDAMKEDMMVGQIYATPEWLLFLKESHKFRKNSPHFFKTLQDIHYMRNNGVQLPKGSEALLKEREGLTYTNKLPKLNVKKDEFFKEEVYNLVVHDDLHLSVALDGVPAYTHFLKDGSEVLTCKDKFWSVSERIRLLSGVEEALVLTIERSLLPNDFKPNPDKMFVYALSKVCSSITGGYFRTYCYDNWYKIIDIYNKECKGVWVDKVKKSIDNGEVRPYNSESSIY